MTLFSFSSISQLSTSLLYNLPLGGFIMDFRTTYTLPESSVSNKISFDSNNVSSEESNVYSQVESSSNFRNNTFLNPIISYDFKCGHYLGIWDKLYPSLMTSFIEQARGIRKSSWIFSDQYQELLKNNYSNYFSNFTSQINLKLSDSENWYSSHVSPIDNYFNFYYNMNLLNFYKDSR